MQNNNPPQVVTRNVVVDNGELRQLTTMFSVLDPDPGSTILRYQVRDNGAGSGQFLQGDTPLEPFIWHDVPASLIGSVQYLGDLFDSQETYSVRAFDGIFWSNLATGQITSGNVSPFVIGTSGRVPINQLIDFEPLVSIFDGDGDEAIEYYIVDRDNRIGGGHFEIDGQILPQATFFNISKNDLPRLRYRGGDSGPQYETISVMANDGFSWGPLSDLQMHTSVNPVITPTGLNTLPNERLLLSTFFTAFDGDGDGISHYLVNDYSYDTLDPATDGSGYLELNGERLDPATFHVLTAAEVASLYWVGAAVGPRPEIVGVQAYDGYEFSRITDLDIITGTLPVVTGTDSSVQAGHYLNLLTGGSSPISGEMAPGLGPVIDFFDPDGDEIEIVGLVDRASNGNGGGFYRNGLRLNSAEWFFFDVADLGMVEYRGGAFGPQGEDIGAMVFANGAWSEVGNFRFDTLINANGPELTALSSTSRLGTVMTLSSLFSWTDAEGDILTDVMIYDTGIEAGSGFVSRDGTPIAAGEWHTFAYDDLHRYRYHFADTSSTELLRIQLSDGRNLSTVETSTLVSNPTPVIDALDNDISLDTLESVPASSLIVQTDGGLPLTRYQVFDEFIQPGSADRSGRMFLRDPGAGDSGEELQGGVVHTLTAEEFSRLEFQGAEADFGRVLDPIIVRATNDLTGWTEWHRVNINTDPVGAASLNRGIRFTDVGDPKQVITYTFIDGGNQSGGTRTNPNYPPLPNYYFPGDPETLNTRALNQLQRESTREVLGEIERYALIDFVEVPYTLDAADAAIVFGAWGPFDGSLSGASAYSITLLDGDGRGNPFGDIWYNRRDFDPATFTDVGLGSIWRQTVGHEVGHSLAFKHPFQDDPSLSIFNNFDYNTIMAYQHDSVHNPFDPYPEFPSTFMLYDVEEIQNIYGANMEYRTGNDHYGNGISGSYPHFVDNSEAHQTTIWDADGIDTINYSSHGIPVYNGGIDLNFDGVVDASDDGSYFGRLNGASVKSNINVIDGSFDTNNDGVIDNNDVGTVNDINILDPLGLADIDGDGVISNADDGFMGVDETIDLREGTWSSINGVPMSLRIAYDVTFENARGGSGDDNITGNEISNLILGNRGNDTITGNGGNDSLRGGTGDDTYVVGAGDGRDLVIEEGGIDTFLKFDPTGSTNAFDDDFTFRRFGDDFRIDFTTDQREAQGTLLIQDFANNPLELMAIHNHLGQQIGNQLDLLSVFQTATDLPQRYEITDTQGANGGFIGVPTTS